MIRKPTWLLLGILLALIGLSVYLNRRAVASEANATAAPTAAVEYLFPAEEGLPTLIRIMSKDGKTVELLRSEAGNWVFNLPVQAEADQGQAEAAASQVTTMRLLSTLDDLDPQAAGLQEPEYYLIVEFTSGRRQAAAIGALAPTESGYYVRKGDDPIVLVSRVGIDSLLNLLTDPPYAATSTPTPAPATATATAAIETRQVEPVETGTTQPSLTPTP